MLRVCILSSREGEIQENTNKVNVSNMNTDKHKEVELLLKTTLEYKLFSWVLSKIYIVVYICIRI